MTTAALAFRIPMPLRTAAAAKAARLGIPLAAVIKNALVDFVSAESFVISDPEVVRVSPNLQKEAMRVGKKMVAYVERQGNKKNRAQ